MNGPPATDAALWTRKLTTGYRRGRRAQVIHRHWTCACGEAR
jgi:hypothetical protein